METKRSVKLGGSLTLRGREEHGARARVKPKVSRTANDPSGPLRQPAMTGVGFSIGMPTMLPHSVHEPS
jgi:hypothetical protein